MSARGTFRNLGKGLKFTENKAVVSTTVAYSVHKYMQSNTAINTRVVGAFVDGRRVGSLTGGSVVDINNEVRGMLGAFKNQYACMAAYASADVMTEVLRRAVDLAPFWLSGGSAVRKGYNSRPSNEGIHLRESGIVTMGDPVGNPTILAGMYKNVSRSSGGSKTLVTSDDVQSFYARGANSAIESEVSRVRSGRNVQMSVSFHRVSAKGFDVAMWTHENLELFDQFAVAGTQPKYLEAAFDSMDVRKEVTKLLARDFAAFYKRNNAGKRMSAAAQSTMRSKLLKSVHGRG